MRTGYKVYDIMTTNPVKIEIDASIKDCAELMTKKDVGSVMVMKNKKFVGIITEKDIVLKVVQKDVVPSKITAEKVMTPLKDVVSIEPDKDIYDALVVMKENNIRRLPVMKGSVLHGLITNKDILRIQPELFDMIFDSFELREQKRKLNLID